jgi:hypothetical protein
MILVIAVAAEAAAIFCGVMYGLRALPLKPRHSGFIKHRMR